MRRLIAGLALAAGSGCASPGVPPGGPEDAAPPRLVRLVPDTGARGVRPPAALFEFDEVVSERPNGVTSLDRLFVVSPRDGEPEVDWRREVIAVRPRRAWRANTVYTITMLPGLVDLRGNVRREGVTLVFSTGGDLPATRLDGAVFDWPAGRPARAYVEAISRPDSVVFVTVGDSTGRFTFLHLQPGRYTVRAFLDANVNRTLDERELWDSVSVTIADSGSVELLAFVHDTIGPAAQTVVVQDSVTLRVGFDRPLHPGFPLTADVVEVRRADSSLVPVSAVTGARAAERERARRDSVRADSAARADSISGAAVRADTSRPAPVLPRPLPGARGAPGRAVPLPAPGAPPARGALKDTAVADTVRRPPVPSRASPESEIIVTLSAPLEPGARYRLVVREARGLLGATRSTDRSFTVAARPVRTDSASMPAPVPPAGTPRRPPRR